MKTYRITGNTGYYNIQYKDSGLLGKLIGWCSITHTVFVGCSYSFSSETVNQNFKTVEDCIDHIKEIDPKFWIDNALVVSNG